MPSNVLSYWLADGGQWFNHGMMMDLSPGPSDTLTGVWSWNDTQNVVWGHARLRLTRQPDGPLAGVFTGSAAYTQAGGPPPAGYQPQPDAPQDGQTVYLVPVAPGLAQVNGGYFGTLYWCQSGLGNVIGWQKETQYCGA